MRLLSHALGSNKLEDIAQEKIDQVVKETGNANIDELMINIGLGNALSIGIARRLTDEFTEDSQHLLQNLKCRLRVLKAGW